MSSQLSFAPGTVFAGDYRIERAIGQGGMGAIFAAEQLSTGKLRALKLMHPTLVAEEEHRRRFVQEARVGSRIASEHVVEVQAAGVDQATGAPYIVMELLEGETLQQRCRRAGAMSLLELKELFEQLCHAVSAAHAAGIVHRDLKPENVFLAITRRAAGPAITVKVLDFGIAKLVAEAGTRGTTGAMGSPLWMAPEQTEAGSITAAADVWALGLIAFYALTGTFFWRSARNSEATVSQLFREIVLEDIPPASMRASEQNTDPLLPPGFDAWFGKCLARAPSARWQDASECWRGMRPMFGDMAPISNEEVFGPTMAGTPISAAPMTPAVITPPVATPQVIASVPPANAIPMGTPPPMAHTQPNAKSSSMGPWILGSAAVIALAIVGSVVALVRSGANEKRTANYESSPSGTTLTLERTPVVTQPTSEASATATVATPPPSASALAPVVSAAPSAGVAAKPVVKASAPSSAGAGVGKVWSWKVSGHTVHIQSAKIIATGNVPEDVIRKAIDWDGWEYGRCYERAFGKATSMPTGSITIKFKIFDQLPQKATVDKSDFTNAEFNECVRGTLVGQTANAAGSSGFADVTYTYLFTLAD